MKRWLFTIIAVFSLVLFLATAALWVRSYRYFDVAGIDGATTWSINSYHGSVVWGKSRWIEARPTVITHIATRLPDSQIDGQWKVFQKAARKLMGFGFGHRKDIDGNEFWALYTPSWFLLLLFALLPVGWLFWKRRQRKIHGVGLCPKCGYDLRATKDRCPECGTSILMKKETKP